jgi:hypothetical protein
MECSIQLHLDTAPLRRTGHCTTGMCVRACACVCFPISGLCLGAHGLSWNVVIEWVGDRGEERRMAVS